MKTILTAFFISLFLTANVSRATEIELPEIGDSAGSLISPAQEYAIGQAFFWRLQQSVDLIDDPEITSYLSSLGYRLVLNSDAPYLDFTFFMVPDSSVNAFAAPGGFIGMHSGLILTSQTEDEVASVIAHEIAHITQRHMLRSFERQQQMSVPMTVAMIAAALLGVADPKVGTAAIMAVQGAGVQSSLNFSRTHESEADNLGMQTLVKAGFDAQAMPTFFERLQQTSRFYTGNAVPEFLRTHPVTTSRIAEARGRAVKYHSRPKKGDDLQFYLMREKLRVITAGTTSDLLSYYQNAMQDGKGINDTATQYGYCLALIKAGNIAQARQILRPLIEQDKDRISYQIALAKMEEKSGQLDLALNIYREYQKLYPDDIAITLNQVKALLLAHQPQSAFKLLERQMEIGNASGQIYKLLAQAKGDMGDKSESHSWLAEYYYASGRLKQAADQLRIAADFARGDEFQLAKLSSRLRKIEQTLSRMEH